MAAAETVKNTVEQFTAAGNVAFKDAVEKSLAQLNELNAHSKKNLEAVIASVTASTKGAEALGAQAMAYSKKAVEDHVAAAKSLSGAKSVQEVIELQTTYAKSALDAYIAHGRVHAAPFDEHVATATQRWLDARKASRSVFSGSW